MSRCINKVKLVFYTIKVKNILPQLQYVQNNLDYYFPFDHTKLLNYILIS